MKLEVIRGQQISKFVNWSNFNLFKKRQIIPQNKALELISTGGWLEGPTRGCVKAPTLRVFKVSFYGDWVLVRSIFFNFEIVAFFSKKNC